MASCLNPSEILSFIEKIPYLLECHQRWYPGAKKIEKRAKQLIESPKEAEEFVEFFKEVCKWGRISRITSRVIKGNEPERIKSILCKGYELANSDDVKDVAEGVNCISGLYGVRQSSASKMLRFLLPNRAVILDSIIRNKCGYGETVHGYKEFLEHCHCLRKQADNSLKISDDFKNLRVCDIEAALFMYIQKPVP